MFVSETETRELFKNLPSEVNSINETLVRLIKEILIRDGKIELNDYVLTVTLNRKISVEGTTRDLDNEPVLELSTNGIAQALNFMLSLDNYDKECSFRETDETRRKNT